MGEAGRLPSMGLHRVRHDWSDLAAAAAYGKIDNLKEMDRFLEKFNLPSLNKEEIEIMNNPNTSTEIEAVIINPLKKKKKAQDQVASQDNSIKHLEKS